MIDLAKDRVSSKEKNVERLFLNANKYLLFLSHCWLTEANNLTAFKK